MKDATIFFHSNIKFLRERKGLSQEELAQALDIKREKLQALESGRTKNPVMEDLINFSEYFNLSIDSILKVDLTRLGELKLRELEAGNDVYMTGSKIRVLAITVNSDNKENVEYVPIKAKAGYRTGYNDPEYIATLPKFNFPELPKGATYRVFPTVGDSMLPIPEDSQILSSYVENWKDIKPKTLCIVILKGEQDFVFKQVSLHKQGLLLESLNKAYDPYIVPVSEVLELWQFYSYQTREIPNGQTDIQELKSMIKDLQQHLLPDK